MQRCTPADISSSLYIGVHNRHIHIRYKIHIYIYRPANHTRIRCRCASCLCRPALFPALVEHCLQIARVMITISLSITHARTPAQHSVGLVKPPVPILRLLSLYAVYPPKPPLLTNPHTSQDCSAHFFFRRSGVCYLIVFFFSLTS